MNIFFVLTVALAIIIFLLRFKIQIGFCMVASGIFIWLVRSFEVGDLISAFVETFTLPRTYDIIFALYFIMCLEIELRVSGALTDMVKNLRRIFSNVKILLAIMPAFLGLLPSVGGARFSAPIVEELSPNLNLTPEHKSAINFWFRHIFEFSSPIIPGMIMACSIAGVPFSEFLKHLSWVTILAFSSGWFILIRPIKIFKELPTKETKQELKHERQGLILSLVSVVSIFLIVIFGGLKASLATFLVVGILFFVLLAAKRFVSAKEIFVGAFDLKMTLNICGILYFIQLLEVTNVLNEIVIAFQNSPLPVPVIIACVSFIIGILTGLSQGHVAIVMPIVAAMGTGNLNLAGIAMAFGVAGQMLTPTHVCLLVTLDYFKANLFGTLKLVLYGEILVLTIFSFYTYLTW